MHIKRQYLATQKSECEKKTSGKKCKTKERLVCKYGMLEYALIMKAKDEGGRIKAKAEQRSEIVNALCGHRCAKAMQPGN